MSLSSGRCSSNIRVMKLFWISICLVAILPALPISVLANPAQEFKITIQSKRTSFNDVFNEIRRQTGFVVFYSNDLFNDKEKISVNFIEAGLDDVMKILLHGRPLGYKIAENFIIIVKAGEKKKDAKAVLGPSIPRATNAADTVPAIKLKGTV